MVNPCGKYFLGLLLGVGIPRAGNGLEAVVPNPDGAPGAVDFADFHVAPVCRFP